MEQYEQEQAVDSNTDPCREDELTLDEKEAIYGRALFRARMRMARYVHVTAFVLVILLLAVINLLTTPGVLWVVWPFFCWGLALCLHLILAPKLMKKYENFKDEEIARQLELRKPQ